MHAGPFSAELSRAYLRLPGTLTASSHGEGGGTGRGSYIGGLPALPVANPSLYLVPAPIDPQPDQFYSVQYTITLLSPPPSSIWEFSQE